MDKFFSVKSRIWKKLWHQKCRFEDWPLSGDLAIPWGSRSGTIFWWPSWSATEFWLLGGRAGVEPSKSWQLYQLIFSPLSLHCLAQWKKNPPSSNCQSSMADGSAEAFRLVAGQSFDSVENLIKAVDQYARANKFTFNKSRQGPTNKNPNKLTDIVFRCSMYRKKKNEQPAEENNEPNNVVRKTSRLCEGNCNWYLRAVKKEDEKCGR